MKPDLNIFKKLFSGRSRRRVRSSNYWTDAYPCHEHSIFNNIVNKISDRIYSNIDSFFRGSTTQQEPVNDSRISFHYDGSSVCCMVWELNQGLTDIAIKDIMEIFRWLVPVIIRKFANRLYQHLVLYFYTDVIVEDESSCWGQQKAARSVGDFNDTKIVIYTIQGFQESINCKFISINHWWFKLFHKLSLLLDLEFRKKTFQLSGIFFLIGSCYSADNQNCMIWKPDRTKLNSAFSFHKRN